MLNNARLLWAAANVIRDQRHLIDTLAAQIDRLAADKDAAELAYIRISRDLIDQFLIALETPEDNDVFRDRLLVAQGFYRDEIAVREEQVGW